MKLKIGKNIAYSVVSISLFAHVCVCSPHKFDEKRELYFTTHTHTLQREAVFLQKKPENQSHTVEDTHSI
jgi:hypothetical protein